MVVKSSESEFLDQDKENGHCLQVVSELLQIVHRHKDNVLGIFANDINTGEEKRKRETEILFPSAYLCWGRSVLENENITSNM